MMSGQGSDMPPGDQNNFPPNQNLVKKEEEDIESGDKGGGNKNNKKEEWKCLDCKKSYKSYPAFYTHNKLKHDGKPPQNYDIPRSLEDIRKDRGRPRVTDSSQRIKFTLQDKHQQKCEDNIYEFLGKLGQKGDESGQRDNTVIRGYLKKPINPAETFPENLFADDPVLFEHAKNIKKQIAELNKELQERNEWEFVDPLELKPDDMTEFSIYNLKSLFYNLRETNKINQYTTIVVYFIWVSKELLAEAYKEIIILSLKYCQRYWAEVLPLKQDNLDQFKTSKSALKEEFTNNNKAEEIYQQYSLSLFEDAPDISSYIDKFVQWYNHFDDNDPIDANEYQQPDNLESGGDEDEHEIDDDDDDQNPQRQDNQPGGDSTTHINPENMFQ